VPAPSPNTEAQSAIACARSLGSRKVEVTSDRVAGIIIAPPNPSSARAEMSIPTEFEAAATAENTPNHVTPNCKMRLRPIRSPIDPIVSSSDANTRM
jgi:hypothetical protein